MSRAPERLNTLLALAAAAPGGAGEGAPTAAAPVELRSALELLSGLPAADRRALEGRVEWLAQLPPAQQSRWLSGRLAGIKGAAAGAALDEHIHPSHVAEVLRGETPTVRTQLLRWLPPALAAQAAELLGVEWAGGRPAPPAPREPRADVLRVIRAKFLSRFVRASELPARTAMDMLSGSELRRLVRLLGAREIAYACRRVSREDVANFLRRFPLEDTHMIVSFVTPSQRVGPGREALAQELVAAAVDSQTPPESMVNHVGVKLLAISLASSGEARLRYTAQKIPFTAAGGLSELVAAGRQGVAPEMVRALAEETEELAATLRQPQVRAYVEDEQR